MPAKLQVKGKRVKVKGQRQRSYQASALSKDTQQPLSGPKGWELKAES
jgi:hypothetical protein